MKMMIRIFIIPYLVLCVAETYGQSRDSIHNRPAGGIFPHAQATAPPEENSLNATTVNFTSSNLPVIVIDTKGQAIQNDPKITARMKIIYNEPPRRNTVTDPGNHYDGFVGIEIRGSYSASLPQKPYGFETRDSLGNNLNVPLLNMPPENDWILIANYNDKTFMRASLAFDLFSKMGHYQTRTRHCEVVVNNEYQGIYVLTEKIKQDKNRIDIATLTAADNSGNDLTGGYIIKIDNSDGSDGWRSKYDAIDRPGDHPYFIYSYPKPEDITDPQKQYIQGFVAKIDSVLRSPKYADPISGYRACLDVASFVDYFIVGEVSRNVDAYKKSAFFYKDRADIDGRLHAGPVWDFDWAWKNINECQVNATDGSGWTYDISRVCRSRPVPPGWMVKLLQDTTFANQLHTRYSLLRKTLLHKDTLYHYVNTVRTLVNEAQVRHYQKWPILGGSYEGTPEVDAQPATFDGEIAKFKNWISTRLAWLDANMPGRDIQDTCVQDTGKMPEEFALLQNYPNPFNPETTIQYRMPSAGTVRLIIYNAMGRAVRHLVDGNLPAGTHDAVWDGRDDRGNPLGNGTYLVRMESGIYASMRKLMLVK